MPIQSKNKHGEVKCSLAYLWTSWYNKYRSSHSTKTSVMSGMTAKLHELVFSWWSWTKKKKPLHPPWHPRFMHKKLELPSCKYQFFSIQVITCITPTLVSGKKAALLSISLESVCQLAKFLPYRRASFHWP